MVLALNAIPIKNVSDDVALLSTAAFFAGDNWNSIISNAGYYGFGFYGLFFFLFRMKLEAETIFRVIVSCVSIMQALSAPICMWVMYYTFHITNWKYCFASSLLVSYLVVNRVCTVSNEHPINFLVWIVILLFCHIFNKVNEGKKTNTVILLILLLLYGLTIHTRSLVLCLAIAVGMFIYALVYKSRKVISKKVFLIAFFLLGIYFLINKSIAFVQQNLWISDETSTLRNASYSVSINDELSVFDIIKTVYLIIVGQINAINFFTVGLSAFLLWAIGKFLIENIRKRTACKEEKCLFAMSAILILAIGGMIFAHSLSWLSGVAEGIISDDYASVYAFKAFSYLRYFMPFIGPLTMVGMVICYYKKNEIMSYIHGSHYLCCVLLIQWMAFIFPKLKDNPQGFTTGLAGLGLVKDYAKVDEGNYYFMIHIFIVGLFIFSYLLKKQRYKFLLGGLIGIMVYQYFFCAYYSDYRVSRDNMKMINSGYEILDQIQEDEDITFPVLYVYDASTKTDHQNFYLYQFYFPYCHIVPELPEDGVEDVILITNKKIDDQLDDDYYSKRLDNNEYLYLGEGQYSDLVKQYIED